MRYCRAVGFLEEPKDLDSFLQKEGCILKSDPFNYKYREYESIDKKLRMEYHYLENVETLEKVWGVLGVFPKKKNKRKISDSEKQAIDLIQKIAGYYKKNKMKVILYDDDNNPLLEF